MPSDDDSDLVIEIKIFLRRQLCRIMLQTSKSMTNNLQWKSMEKKSKSITFAYKLAKKKRRWSKYKNHQV